MIDVPLWQIALLTFAALCAGLVDAIAGGGGLITLPSLLAVGLPPHLALGTNKGQSVFGSFAALVRFLRSGLVDKERAKISFPLGLLGAFAGALLVMTVPPDALRPIVLVLLVAAGAYVTLRRPGPPKAVARTLSARHKLLAAALIAAAIGFYDGFFGPGTGTFLILAFVAVFGDTLQSASASAKVVNFASNLASVALFAALGNVVWAISLPMALGQFTGGWIGAHLTVKGGDRIVKRVVLVVVIALVVKVARDVFA